MTRRPQLDERDPAEPRTWVEASSAWARREALARTREAVEAARDKRKKPAETEETPDVRM